ncbi:MAG: hypothetical protein ACRDIB_11715, partial [Ardenticatenaceae bacterium]
MWLYLFTFLLLLALPFEITRSRLRFAGLEWTNLELLLAAVALGWAGRQAWLATTHSKSLQFIGQRRWLPLVAVALLWFASVILSASMAPVHQVDALKFAARLGSGLLLFFLTISIVTTKRRLTSLMWAVSLGAGIS